MVREIIFDMIILLRTRLRRTKEMRLKEKGIYLTTLLTVAL